MGLIPAGCYNNKKYLQGKYELRNIEPWLEDVLFDPQTSGGLLISISSSEGKALMEKLSKLEIPSQIIGEVVPKGEKYIIVE